MQANFYQKLNFLWSFESHFTNVNIDKIFVNLSRFSIIMISLLHYTYIFYLML
jgi:hypothetical protein